MIVDGQDGVCLYLPNHNCSREDFGLTKILDCGCACTNTVRGIVPDYPDDGYYYALVTLDENGERTIEWQTTTCTEATTYKIHTQRWIPDDILHLDLTRPFAEACVIVQKGVVTLNTEVCGQITSTSYLGETVRIFGTNTDSKITYLFITGPCQACPGENMTVTNEVEDGNPNTFTKVMVKSDNTWEYYWETRDLSIDLGQYTIYAASMPNDAQALEGVPCIDCEPVKKSCAAWAKKPFTFLEPTIFADIHPKILRIVCCLPPDIVVSGTATGLRGEALIQDHNGLLVSSGQEFFDKDDTVPLGLWVFGENKVAGEKYIFDTIYVDCPTGNFSANIKNYVDTLALQPGTYTVIVQHPMYNHRLDIIPEDEIAEQSEWYWWWKFLPTYMKDEVWYPDANKQFVVTATPVRWSKLFVIDGPDRLVGTQALNALLIGFQNPNIDDNIVTLTFKVESNTALVADFSGSPQTGAAPLAVQFTDISLGNPTSWSWAFGDGETSNVRNPQHTYAGPGTYNVGLTVTNAGGSSSITKNAYITVTGVTPTVTPTVPPVNPNQINLMTGWNFVSTPMVLADGQNTVGTVFASVNTGGRSIYLYDASTGLWDAMAASDPFVPLDGIWIYSTTPKQVTLTFKSGGASTPPTKNVYEGWNAIGFAGPEPRSAAATLVSVNDPPRKMWAQVIGWNAASQAYKTPIANVAPDNTAQLFPTNGYWLFMSGDNAPWVLS
jgi:PKD repeat protein